MNCLTYKPDASWESSRSASSWLLRRLGFGAKGLSILLAYGLIDTAACRFVHHKSITFG